MTIENFIKENYLEIKPQILEKIALSDNKVLKYPATYDFVNLEELIIKYNLTCSITIQTKQKFQAQQNTFIYIMKVFENDIFTNSCKIGYSTEPFNRLKTVQNSMQQYYKNKTLKLYALSEPVDNSTALKIEQAIHTILNAQSMNINIPIQFDGSTEFFKYSRWIDNMLPFAKIL